MAIIKIDEYTANALEKGLASTIKAADLRWYDYGNDMKKATPGDNRCVGPVAYVKLTDPKNPDPDIAHTGTVTKMFYMCNGTSPDQRYVTMESVENCISAINTAKLWVETRSMTFLALTQKCPTIP